MARSLCSFFIDDTAAAALAARVPNSDWNSGGTIAGSCSPGIGISTSNPGLAEQLPNWTLLDQRGNARNAQRGQHIGGPGISNAGTSSGQEGTLPDATIRLYDVDSESGDGKITLPANGASLISLAAGWAEQV